MERRQKQQFNQKIDAMVRRIVKRFHPAKIILFGSYAKGNAGPDSDIDLLIIMPVRGSRHKKAVEIGVALHDIDIPKDVIVVTPEEFEWRKDVIGTIEWPAVREGRVLYAKSA
jgi:predicted nucleotidyltransferase